MSSPITLAITDHVPLADKDRYEQLVDELHQLFRGQDGFLSVNTVRHSLPHQVEYTVLLRWVDQSAASKWKSDGVIRHKLAQIEGITSGTAKAVEASGLGLWIDHAQGKAASLPPFWKRVAMSILAVYPLLMLLLAASSPVIGSLPQPMQVLIVVILLSTLLTWPIMPWLSGVLRHWLLAK